MSELLEKTKCTRCDGRKEVYLSSGEMKGHIIQCWYCGGTGEIPLLEKLRGLMFEAMAQDSINLRQNLLWTFKHVELESAGQVQIKRFEESIADGLEEDFIIEEYKKNLKSFKEWLEIFLLDAQVIYLLRSGLITYKSEVESMLWYAK